MYALIMAGGSGTRLWPRSKKTRPKQLLDLLSGRTMFQEAYDRVAPLFGDEGIFIVTSGEYVPAMRQQVPAIPAANYIVEPSGRGTAPCIGLAALYLRRADPEGVMCVLTADHYIKNVERFRQVLRAAARVAEDGYLVTLGITPSFPSTGFGYIRRSAPLGTVDGFEVFRVEKFTEKPDAATAQRFCESGIYSWNSGMFIWRVSVILSEFERLMPTLYAQLMEIDAAIGTPEERTVLERVWPQVEKQTIDYGIMERATDVAVIPVDIGWNDVGSWATLLDILPADGDGNVVTGQHLGVDTHGCLIYSPDRLVATVGLEGMVVVDAGDVLLICPRKRAQEVREVVKRLREAGKEEYL
ncbi:MAG: mannose-1-phosphate guanyltransferase [Chloroflexi bacterium]|nr:mannose-1-phosphate guanylyltransferase [Anaerolineae bacterium]RLC74269.1 MAG: mannose-1-phosphate guanyltransferase [Chloroflexota bacterium]